MQDAGAVDARADDDAPSAKKPATLEPKKPATRASRPAPATNKPGKPVSFMRDVAPILVENCIACHNPRKSESKYVMTTFAQLAKGGQQGEGITLEPGEPDESRLVELIRLDGNPRMPFKQDPLPKEKSRSSSAGSRKGPSTTATRPARTGRSSCARRSRSRSPRPIP